jgi:DNA-binding GntR family transcriptional regulator
MATAIASPTELLARAVARGRSSAAPTRSLLRDEVYAQVRGWILDGSLPPQTRLRDKDIAEVLSVSRTPVREALRRLEDERLVVAEASRWTKVAPVDTDAADRLYPIVWTLERLAVSSSGTWDAKRIAALRAANARLASAVAHHDALAASEADTEFHRLAVEAAGNEELVEVLEDLKVRMRRIELVYFDGTSAGERSVEEHERVIDALASGDVDRAGTEVERNWRASLDRLHERRAAG